MSAVMRMVVLTPDAAREFYPQLDNQCWWELSTGELIKFAVHVASGLPDFINELTQKADPSSRNGRRHTGVAHAKRLARKLRSQRKARGRI